MVTNDWFGARAARSESASETSAGVEPASGIVRIPERREVPPPRPSSSSSGIELRFALHRKPCKVLRVSPMSVVFEPQPGEDYLHGRPHEVSLLGRGHTIHRLWGVISAEGEALRLTFLPPPREHMQQIVALLRDIARSDAGDAARRSTRVEETITDPARVVAIVKALACAGTRGSLRVSGGELGLRIRAVSEDGQIHWHGRAEWQQGPYTVEIIGNNSIYRLFLDQVRAEDGHPVTPMPTRVERIVQRFHRRSMPSGGVAISFRHPIWPDQPRVQREIRDVSFGGMSFSTSLDDDLLYPGIALSMEVRDEAEGKTIRLKGEVRSVTPGRGDEPACAGVKVAPRSPQDEQRWNRLVARTLHPTTVDGSGWSESVWDLFERSGYFSLSGKSPDHFVELKKSFVQVGEKVAKAPELVCQAVFPSERGAEASVSIMKPYRSTWMLHSLAKRPQTPANIHSRLILRDLYVRAFEHAQADRRFRWAMAYAEATVKWNHVSLFEFAKRYGDSGLAVVMPFDLMEFSCADRSGERAPGVEIAKGGPGEVAALLQRIGRQRPKAFVESLDLTAESFDMGEICQSWRAAGLRRERALLVARSGGAMIAAAIVETGETGTNLFRLMDSMRLFATAPGGERAFPQLVDAARAWFTAQGKDSFIYFREEDQPRPTEAMRAKDLGEGRLWIVSATLLPEFLEHILEVTSPRGPIALGTITA